MKIAFAPLKPPYESINATSTNGLVDSTVILSGDGSNVSTQGGVAHAVYNRALNGALNSVITLSGDNSALSTTANSSRTVDVFARDNIDLDILLSGDNSNISATVTQPPKVGPFFKLGIGL